MKRLRRKSGASMMFVLAAMLLLMALGVSALAAAFGAFGARHIKRDENQLDLYAGSMERTLKAVLEDTLPDAGARIDGVLSGGLPTVTTLSGQVLKAAYDEAKASCYHPGTNPAGETETFTHSYGETFKLDSGDIDGMLLSLGLDTEGVEFEAEIRFALSVRCTPHKCADWEAEYNYWTIWTPPPPYVYVEFYRWRLTQNRVPQSAEITGTAEVTVTTAYSGGYAGAVLTDPLTVKTKTLYKFDGGRIDEQQQYPGRDIPRTEYGEADKPNCENIDLWPRSDMFLTDPGSWEVTGHERLDT
ncbi:MAG: hypothetical protein LBH95_02265 [Oscillospiraceae bacterium]|jgi:hypothetical protein|nr:hypothetical protein [Oscillospiraceae bacterium]